MGNKYFVLFLQNVKDFIETLPSEDQGKINATITSIELGSFESIYIKTVRTPIKELIIKKYRIIFFIHHTTIYFIGAFVKKTAKTPSKEIKNAEKIYKIIIENNKK